MARHVRRSFEPISPSPSFCAEIQQLPAASRYSTTVTQPPMVGSPIIGVQLKWVTRDSLCALQCALAPETPNTTSVVTAHRLAIVDQVGANVESRRAYQDQRAMKPD